MFTHLFLHQCHDLRFVVCRPRHVPLRAPRLIDDFTDDAGGFLRKSNFMRRVWESLKEAGELPDHFTFHDLRHAHASTLLRENVHPKLVQERRGHSSIKLTMDTYSHLMPDAQDVAADAIDRVRRTPIRADGCQTAVKTAV
jgi:integrase